MRFIGEPVRAEFDRPPQIEKKPGCPNRFVRGDETYEIIEILSEWHDYGRRGIVAHTMRPSHAAAALKRGSWGVGRDYFQIRVHTGQVFEIYYDRSPSAGGGRKGAWFLYREMHDAG